MNPIPASPLSSRFRDAHRVMSEQLGVVARPRVMHLGLDLGTGNSRLLGAWEVEGSIDFRIVAPTLVGHAKAGLVGNLLPKNARMVFGRDAVRHRLHLDLVQPVIEGRIVDPDAAHAFTQFLVSQMDVQPPLELRGVVGIPARTTPAERQGFRDALTGTLDAAILVPKPFLAALGFRDETRLADPDYLDPARNSIFVDLGAGGTEACLVQGAYPSQEQQISVGFGGDLLDQRLSEAIRQACPESNVSLLKVRELKETYAFVGTPEAPAKTELYIKGVVQKVDLTPTIGASCRELLQQVYSAVIELVARADSDSVPELVQNVFLTGGGARVRNIEQELTRLLRASGMTGAQVRIAGDTCHDLVALGAIKAAQQARLDQWQRLGSDPV